MERPEYDIGKADLLAIRRPNPKTLSEYQCRTEFRLYRNPDGRYFLYTSEPNLLALRTCKITPLSEEQAARWLSAILGQTTEADVADRLRERIASLQERKQDG